ncbi:MAG: hypothetical protein WC876_03520 [Candidatus Thermoplasmatota archaeon]|jgi:hypothetical protein
MSHQLQHAAILVFVFVAVAMLVLTILGASAYRRDRRPFVLFIALAFGVFFVKSAILAVGYWQHLGAPELYELLGSLFDLIIAGLLIAPFLIRK